MYGQNGGGQEGDKAEKRLGEREGGRVESCEAKGYGEDAGGVGIAKICLNAVPHSKLSFGRHLHTFKARNRKEIIFSAVATDY